MWPLNRGDDCLIRVAFKTGLTVLIGVCAVIRPNMVFLTV